MKNKTLITAITLLLSFVLWTLLILIIDVRPVGVNDTSLGFATLNIWLHKLLGVHMSIYMITDWLSLIPLSVCSLFAGIAIVAVFAMVRG